MKATRKPRKQIRLKAAADILQVSRGTVRNLIFVDRKLEYVQPKPGTSSPIRVYESQVNELAREWGIL